MSMSLSFLQNIGLTDTESHLYELLLRLGEAPVGTLIQESNLKRPTVYKALHMLHKKGLVTQRDIHKKIHVRPESPIKLQELADKKYEQLNRTKESLKAFLPSLAISYTLSTERPVVRVYEGIDGLKEIYKDLLIEGKTIYAILQAANVDPELYKWLTTKFVRKRVRAKIHVKAIVSSSAASREYLKKSKEEYRIARLIDSKKFPFQHEIDIYGDKVAIVHYKKDEPLIGMVIHHPQIALTMKAWFDLGWETANHVPA